MGNLMSLGYIWSAKYTILSHSCLFNSLGGCFLVIGGLIMRHVVHKKEILGTVVSIIGCIITLFDGKAEKID